MQYERELGKKENPVTKGMINIIDYPAVDFNDYMNICNQSNDGSRRRGILSEKWYEIIVNDPQTGFVNSGNHSIPVLMDGRHGLAMGYDIGRCETYANEFTPNIKILTLPIHELTDNQKKQVEALIKENDNCALYFSDHNHDEATVLNELLTTSGISYQEKPLIDTRAAKGDEQAAMFLYSCCAEQNESRCQRKKIKVSDVQAFYDNHMGPSYDLNGKCMTTLELGSRISDQKAEEMWLLYDKMFEFLGEGHPISMQDSKEDFFKLLCSDRTIVCATYVSGEGGRNKLACFTYFIDDMEMLYWLNPKYLEETMIDFCGRHEYITNLFTPGLVSAGVGNSYALFPITLCVRVLDEAGLNPNMLFENTNLSKRVVPWIVDRAVKKGCKYADFKTSQMVDKVTYRLWFIDRAGE